MQLIIRFFSQLSSTHKLPSFLFLTLALTGILSCGIGVTTPDASVAVPSNGQTQVAQNSLPKAIAQTVLKDASKRSGVKINDLKIIESRAQTFGNPCIFKFGEICTKEFRPIEGWVVVVQVKDQAWTYHVNKSGTQLVLDPKVNVAGNAQLPPKIANLVLNDAAKRSGLPVQAIKITEVTKKTFGNPCEFAFGEVCAQLFDPVEGWIVIVKVKGQSWTYHVDTTGSRLALDPKVKQ
ncbi:MAG TPA: hypothetical protein VK203_26810 [Nostocaceae cyanobacterium]|nr:hypothetical protein [Nostocaceae cyanobacterium]